MSEASMTCVTMYDDVSAGGGWQCVCLTVSAVVCPLFVADASSGGERQECDSNDKWRKMCVLV